MTGGTPATRICGRASPSPRRGDSPPCWARCGGWRSPGGRNRKGMPGLLDAALLVEAFGDEMVFERPPPVVQHALAATVAPIARRRGRSVTGDVIRASIIA